MLYPHDIEQKIGFDKIRQLLKNYCLSDLARTEIDNIAFSNDFELIIQRLTPIHEMTNLLADGTSLPLNAVADLRQAFADTRIEGTFLEISDIVSIRQNALTTQQITTFLTKIDAARFPTLIKKAKTIPTFPEILKRIDLILDKFGEIKDNASPELAQTRHNMRKAQAAVSRTLNAILKQAQSDGLVEKDAAPTMRDGRLVIPILAMNKRRLSGIIHNESATGKTAFVEPNAVVEVNNRLRELENEERREIMRILVELTNFLRPFYPDLLDSAQFLAEIDTLQAKAKFALKINAIKPYLKNNAHIDWHAARHPLLQLTLEAQQKQIVPLDIKLTENQRILLISGPNAGGKSICLKTVGLLQFMLQCGLPIPIDERSEAGIFDDIFIDIGDEQSLENDLSTYSSHLLNMKHCLRHSNPKTLLLIDEFGTGTEPQIGGAIAEAVLEKLNQNKTFGVITTHYTNLKHFAAQVEGIANGAMLYDRHQMQPLFCLQIGNPGSSFAVEIARKIGLPTDVIESAAQKVGQEHIDYDKNLQDAARDKRYWENKRQKIREKEKQIDQLKQQYDEAVANLKQERKQILREAKTHAADLIAQANAQIEKTIRTIKESKADKEITKNARKKLDSLKQNLTESQKSAKPKTQKPLKIGDHVKIKGQNIVGTILDVNEKTAIVAFGQIKSTVACSKLELSAQTEQKSQQQTSVGKKTTDEMHQRRLAFKQDIDVRGMRVDEALTAVMHFIDDAEMFASGTVRILHGTGTGALRQAIRDYFHNARAVKNYHDEHVQFGGAGITVVELK